MLLILVKYNEQCMKWSNIYIIIKYLEVCKHCIFGVLYCLLYSNVRNCRKIVKKKTNSNVCNVT